MVFYKKNILVEKKGVTLLELMIAMAVFSIFIAIVYPSLNFIKNQINILNGKVLMSERGRRIMDFIEDDLKMVAFIVGPTARIPYCTGGVVPSTQNVLTHGDGNPYDSLTFITSRPVELAMTASCINNQKDSGVNPRIDYLLTTRDLNATTGANTIDVDADTSSGAGCVDLVAASGNNNARSLVTFETIAPSIVSIADAAPQVYYTLTAVGTTLTLNESLQQDIPDNSSVFTVRQYRYDVDTANGARDLRRVEWNADCTDSGSLNRLDVSTDTKGGIDGLQFEYLSVDTISGLIVTTDTVPDSLSDLKAIKIWLLLRAEYPDKNYTNSDTYTVGGITLGPFNDNYRRELLTRIVEVKNLGL